ncbi:transcriptional regulator [Sporolactobacillus terrae]|nr:transcriptional regulator [Sporolactobacillus terrae]QAA27083.1 transcriptional regulator [Sporolactobacillus terrae]UAK18020.1 helix-turn-helix transcriptional regulator [Sporolactobacillus terrae]
MLSVFNIVVHKRSIGAVNLAVQLQNQVKALRARYGLTQEQLGARVGVTRQTIASIEKGNYVPSLLLGLQICEVFQLPAEKVFQLEKGVAEQ